MLFEAKQPSPLGLITMVSDGTNLVGLYLEGQKYFCSSIREKPILQSDLPIFDVTKDWLKRYFSGKKPEIASLSLNPAGSEFRHLIWKLLCEIPYGQTTTYGALAQKASHLLNRPRMSAQAVGGAVAHNPISIIIPCHRVIGSNGSLTGYAGGIDRKVKLLQLEGINIDLSDLHVCLPQNAET